MIPVPSEIEGKQAVYGEIKQPLEKEGFVLGDNWEYDRGFFDGVLRQENASTTFLRIPVKVVENQLDQDNARLQLGQPFILKHVINKGYSQGHTENPTYDPWQMGYLVNQFQEPLDHDGEIEQPDHWIQEAQSRLEKIKSLLQ